eukprot:365573-Chlamydomonas_euryale.AAC.1
MQDCVHGGHHRLRWQCAGAVRGWDGKRQSPCVGGGCIKDPCTIACRALQVDMRARSGCDGKGQGSQKTGKRAKGQGWGAVGRRLPGWGQPGPVRRHVHVSPRRMGVCGHGCSAWTVWQAVWGCSEWTVWQAVCGCSAWT